MYIHKNTWCWGRTHTIICWNGLGFVNISIENDNPSIAIIHGISVLPSFRGEGKGTAILTYAEKEAKEMGAYVVSLAVEPNSWMERWYKRKGYEFNSYDENNLMVLVKNLE